MSTRVAMCTWGLTSGGLREEDEETLTLARRIAEANGAELRLVVLGAISDGARLEAGRYAVTAIDAVGSDELSEIRPDAYVAALASYLRENPADAVLLSQTFDARLVAPRLAGAIDAGVVMNCVEIARAPGGFEATVTAYGGDTRVVYQCSGAATYVFAVAANAVEAEPLMGEQPAPPVNEIRADLTGVKERIRVVERPQASEGPKLEHANIIVAGGRGLGSAENFRLVEELAAALGGMAAASRPIVDDGWAKPAQQVGLTGKITKPALYLAAGISGASQHMVGCTAAKTLVAINRDRDAAIFRYARFGIVGDCLEVLPELTDAVKKAEQEEGR